MKPSERIEELFNQQPYWSNLPGAIITYLDEEYEKKQKEELDDLIQKDIKSNFRSKPFYQPNNL